MNKNEKTITSITPYINAAVKNYKFQVNHQALQSNILALEEVRYKDGASYANLVVNSENAKRTALAIINLSNKNLIYGEDFNIVKFSSKMGSRLTLIIDSSVYQREMEKAGWNVKKDIIFKGEKVHWDSIKQIPISHEKDFFIDTGNYDNIVGAYAFATNNERNDTKGIFVRKSDIKRWKDNSPSANSFFLHEKSDLKKWYQPNYIVL